MNERETLESTFRAARDALDEVARQIYEDEGLTPLMSQQIFKVRGEKYTKVVRASQAITFGVLPHYAQCGDNNNDHDAH